MHYNFGGPKTHLFPYLWRWCNQRNHTNLYVSSNETIENLSDGNLIGGSTGDEENDHIIMQKEALHGKHNYAIVPTFGNLFEPTDKRPICRKFYNDWSGEVIAVVLIYNYFTNALGRLHVVTLVSFGFGVT